jgi:hypothetical protein
MVREGWVRQVNLPQSPLAFDLEILKVVPHLGCFFNER